MLNLLPTLIFILIIGCAPKPIEQHNDHWQKGQDKKFIFCHENARTYEQVEQCLFELGVFI